MKKCFICGEEANIFNGERWLCEKHYLMGKEREKEVQQALETDDENVKKVDLGLAEV